MNTCLILVLLIVVSLLLWLIYNNDESFDMDHYLRPNYETGAAMIRGDLPIQPVQQSWFNTRYGPNSLVPSFMQF